MPAVPGGYGPVMSTRTTVPASTSTSRSRPGPNRCPRRSRPGDVGDRRAEAAEILRDSEERVAEAVEGNAPGDAADEHRPSDEGV